MFDIIELTPKTLAIISVCITLFPVILLIITGVSGNQEGMTLFGSLSVLALPISIIGLFFSLAWVAVRWLMAYSPPLPSAMACLPPPSQ